MATQKPNDVPVERRKPGRPKMPPELKLSVTVSILVTPDEADALYVNARRRRCPMSEMVREACRKAGLMSIEPSP